MITIMERIESVAQEWNGTNEEAAVFLLSAESCSGAAGVQLAAGSAGAGGAAPLRVEINSLGRCL